MVSLREIFDNLLPLPPRISKIKDTVRAAVGWYCTTYRDPLPPNGRSRILAGVRLMLLIYCTTNVWYNMWYGYIIDVLKVYEGSDE